MRLARIHRADRFSAIDQPVVINKASDLEDFLDTVFEFLVLDGSDVNELPAMLIDSLIEQFPDHSVEVSFDGGTCYSVSVIGSVLEISISIDAKDSCFTVDYGAI